MKNRLIIYFVHCLSVIFIMSCNDKSDLEKNKSNDVNSEFINQEINRLYIELDSMEYRNLGENRNTFDLLQKTHQIFDSIKKDKSIKIKPLLDKLDNIYGKLYATSIHLDKLIKNKSESEIKNNIKFIELAFLQNLHESWLKSKIISNISMYKAIEYEKNKYIFSYVPKLDSTNSKVQFYYQDEFTDEIKQTDTTFVKYKNLSGVYYFENKSKIPQELTLLLTKKNGEYRFCQIKLD